MDSELEDRYFLDYIIGCGTYSKVYSGHDKTNKNEIAVKFEMLTSFDDADNSYLKREYDVYSKLTGKDSIGVADIKMFGCDEGKVGEKGPRNYLVMELLGLDLEKLLQQCSGKFSLKTVLLLADQMISIIQYIHLKGYIHGDVKPGNFLLGRKEKDNMLYMVDFWLAKEYIDPLTKNHISYNETARCQGITRFTSINCHKGIGQSRRDDLESLGYVFLYLLRGNLPWPGITVTENIDEKEQEKRLVYEKKVSISLKELCFGQSSEFETYLEYCRSLKFDEEPDYAYLKKIFKDLFHRSGFTEDNEYDWKITQPNNGVLSNETNMENHTDKPFLRSTSPEGKRRRGKRKRGVWFTDSSDDKVRKRKAKNYSDEKVTEKYFLKSNLNSSEVDAEDVFYYFNLMYKPIEESELNLHTTEECLEQLLKFVASKQEFDSENDFKWDNMSMSDIVEHYIKYDEDIAWIYKWDNLDWKTATKKEVVEKTKFIQICGELIGKPLFFMQSAYYVYLNRHKFKKGGKSEGVKRFFDSVATLTSPHEFRRYGFDCEEHLKFSITEDKITDVSQSLESRDIKVTVNTDGVFTNPSKTDPEISWFLPKWEVVLEIYSPSAEEVLAAQEDKKECSNSLLKKNSSAGRSHNDPVDSVSLPDSGIQEPLMTDTLTSTPAKSSLSLPDPGIQAKSSLSLPDPGIQLTRRPDIIADPAYRSRIREHIRMSLPISYRDNLHIIKKMAGHHVLQLFAQFKRRHMVEKSGERLSTIEKSIGIFVINEFIYFSRLDVSSLVYRIVTGEYEFIPFHHKASVLEKSPPEVRFSNFHLDITKRNHRLALVIFLKKYLFPKVIISGYPSEEQMNSLIKSFPK